MRRTRLRTPAQVGTRGFDGELEPAKLPWRHAARETELRPLSTACGMACVLAVRPRGGDTLAVAWARPHAVAAWRAQAAVVRGLHGSLVEQELAPPGLALRLLAQATAVQALAPRLALMLRCCAQQTLPLLLRWWPRSPS